MLCKKFIPCLYPTNQKPLNSNELRGFICAQNKDIFLSGALDKRKAKIGDYFDLQEQWTAERHSNPVKKAMEDAWGKISRGEMTIAQAQELEAKAKIYEDFGAWATMKGYDAYYVKNDRYWVVLNRTKLIMRDADIKPAAQVPYFIKDNAGTRFKQQLTPQEIAAKRHAARTAEQKQAIQRQWNERRFSRVVDLRNGIVSKGGYISQETEDLLWLVDLDSSDAPRDISTLLRWLPIVGCGQRKKTGHS